MPTTAGKAWLFYALAVLAVSPATVVAEPEAPDASAGHPRLIVTREQLTNLRTRLNSPAGKAFVRAILARIGEDWKHTAEDDAVGQAFLYALTGEKSYLDPVKKTIEQWIAKPGSGPTTAGRAAVAVLSYDLIYDACDAELRKRMHEAIEANYVRIRDITDCRPNRSMASNWNARWRPALGLMALTLLNEPGCDQDKAREMLAFAQKHVSGYLNSALGSNGWNAEGDHYTAWSLRSVLPFVHAHRNCLGKNLPGAQRAGQYLAVTTVRTVFEERGLFYPALGIGQSGLYFHRDLLAMAYPLVEQSYQPGVLWHWQRIDELRDHQIGPMASLSPTGAVYRFLNYPAQGTASDPGLSFPRVWADHDKGAYFFRNRWEGENDLLAVFHAKHRPLAGGWRTANAGVFRIYGLGHPWIVRGLGGKVNHWSSDNAVLGKDIPAATNGGEKVTTPTTFLSTSTEGSGSLTVDMKDVYSKPALRSFAVDYSGQSGAEALYVVYDRIDGKANRQWQVFVAGTVEISERGFVITHRDSEATMDVTFLLPRKPKIEKIPAFGFKVTNPRDRSGRKINAVVRGKRLSPNQGRQVDWVVRAEGVSEFLVVMTLQKGQAPEVKATENGRSASVGDRRILLQKGRIVVRGGSGG